MDPTIRFLGAAQNVTGSRYLLTAFGKNVLIDCGYYQERNFRLRNWDPFPFPPGRIDCLVLTHAHLDHCGLIPKLVREGFTGDIHCTSATAEIAKIVLLDSAHIQEEDAAFKRLRHKREKRTPEREVVALYTTEDAEASLEYFIPHAYEEPVSLGPDLEVTFHDAGHILGSAMVRFRIGSGGDARYLLFSGDIGRYDKPILQDPTVFEQADTVVMESTYGDRIHEDNADIDTLLADAVNAAKKKGGNLVIPSFAIGRTQEILYRLNELIIADKIPRLMTFVDSPMAVNVTNVFKNHREMFDEETIELLQARHSPFAMPNLKMVQSVQDSKAINHINGTTIIIAASGMCTGGRVKHHLAHNIGRPSSIVLFVGYQASGTLGRIILEGQKDEVRILGTYHRIRAEIRRINGFSAHADQRELLDWVNGVQRGPRRIFVTHGEPEAASTLAGLLSAEGNRGGSRDVIVPEYGQEEAAFKSAASGDDAQIILSFRNQRLGLSGSRLKIESVMSLPIGFPPSSLQVKPARFIKARHPATSQSFTAPRYPRNRPNRR
jgi:metallo-beta-lactamase family protein